jgi:nucleotide-binding universal stress UspA family protein
MYETILFPTDGSDPSFHALDHALDIAETYDASLHALYVVETSSPYDDFGTGGIDPELLIQTLHERGEEALERVEERADRAGRELVGATREFDDIHGGILEYADEYGADLIVMGTHGRRGLNRWLLGSVAERVVRTSDIPVLTVRERREEDE